MNYEIFIDLDSANTYLEQLANRVAQRLNDFGYNAKVLANDLDYQDKLGIITDDSLVISNNLNSDVGAEIIYALKDDDTLSSYIEANLRNFTTVTKYYQQRLPSDTALDFYEIIRDTPNSETIVISFTQESLNTPTNNWQNMANSIADGIVGYIRKENIYVVQAGDSLYSIATKFGTTVDELKDANDLASNSLSIGQELIIPRKTTSEEEVPPTEDVDTYTVQSGDNLYSIARRFNTSVDELKKLNNLTSNSLSIGQVLKLPSGEEPDEGNTYIVQSGDSLYSIARKFTTTVDEIKRLNNLTSNTLSIGQTLKIPTITTNIPTTRTYTVQSGDSLYSIARSFNTTVDELKRINNLTTNTLSIGQVLTIPSDDTTSTERTYTVKSGDSLYSIARSYGTTVDALKQLNSITSNTLSIGQVLKIPSN